MNKPVTIRVMLVDDHMIIRRGLAACILEYDDLELVAEASDGLEALQACERVQPDVILMDLLMPRMDGATATQAIRERYPDVKVLMLTSSKESEPIQNALKAGAIGYLLKDVSAQELVSSIRVVYQGHSALAPEAASALLKATLQRDVRPLGHDLSERELKVLHLLVKGMDNNQIASSLVVSLSTVRFHVSRILTKLQATNRTEAVAIALKHHLVAHSP